MTAITGWMAIMLPEMATQESWSSAATSIMSLFETQLPATAQIIISEPTGMTLVRSAPRPRPPAHGQIFHTDLQKNHEISAHYVSCPWFDRRGLVRQHNRCCKPVRLWRKHRLDGLERRHQQWRCYRRIRVFGLHLRRKRWLD